MKVTLPTAQLQSVLTKAVRGAGNNKLIPMTSLIAIEVKNGEARYITTDATNYLVLKTETGAEDFYVAVQVDLLAKLVSKLTCEEVTLEVTDSCLNVVGNGKYQIDLVLDDDGNPVKLPDPMSKWNTEKTEELGKTEIATIVNTVMSLKSSLLDTVDYPWYTCYYVNDKIIMSTDTYTVGSYARGFLNKPYLIGSDVMDLVCLLNGDIAVSTDGTFLKFEAQDGVVIGKVVDGIDRYAIDDLNALVEQDFENSCKVSKQAILSLLDRISLFVGQYDNGEITLSFKADKLEVSSRYASEPIKYAEPSDRAEEFTCKTDIGTLIPQIKAQLGSVFEIQYGKENAIKLIDGELTSVVALLEE